MMMVMMTILMEAIRTMQTMQQGDLTGDSENKQIFNFKTEIETITLKSFDSKCSRWTDVSHFTLSTRLRENAQSTSNSQRDSRWTDVSHFTLPLDLFERIDAEQGERAAERGAAHGAER